MAISIYQQRLIDKRREQNLCQNCGKPLDRDGFYCIQCRKGITDYNTETRHFFQSIGICPRCKKNKLYGDEKNCPECAANQYINTMRSRARLGKEHYNKTHAEWAKQEYQRRSENGICTRCGKRNAMKPYKTCGICTAKERERKRTKYGKPDRSERYKQGLCYFCDNPVKDGYKVCEKHYQMNIEKLKCDNVRENIEKLKKTNSIHYFRKDGD